MKYARILQWQRVKIFYSFNIANICYDKCCIAFMLNFPVRRGEENVCIVSSGMPKIVYGLLDSAISKAIMNTVDVVCSLPH